MGDKVFAEDLGRFLLRLFGSLGQLHTPALATATRVNLCLHHTNSAKLSRNDSCFLRSCRDLPDGHRHAVSRENLLSLIFMDIHNDRSPIK